MLIIIKIAIPSMICQIFANLMEIINLIFVGRLGDTAKIAGVGLGNVYINMVAQSVILGMNGGV